MRRLLLLFAAVLGIGGLAGADADPFAQALTAWCRAESDTARAEAVWALWQEDPLGDRTAAALAGSERWAADAPAGELLEWKQDVPGVGEHTIHGFVPASYTPDRAWPLLVWLHGAVARDGDGAGRSGLGLWAEHAQDDDFLLLCPSARKGSEWWTPRGAALVLDALKETCRRYRVDANRVLLAGFSDGGSGCWSFLAQHPGPFCGMAALMGNPLVPRVLGGPTFATNLSSRPVFAANGGRDQLYPSERVRDLMEQIRAEGCDLTWIDIPEAGHDISQVAALWPQLRQWWIEHPRDPLPTSVAWQCLRGSASRGRDWIEIVEVAAEAQVADGLAGGVMPSPRTEASLGYGQPRGSVRARRHADGEIEIDSEGVTRLRLHLPQEWWLGAEGVRVRWNGTSLPATRPPGSLAYLLERQDGRGDGEPLWRAPLWLPR